jgi:pantoate--beta-alanine ligase
MAYICGPSKCPEMEIFKEIEPVKAFLSAKKSSHLSVGFVPTMGALHAGHLALIAAAKAENDITVCSIFINPAQFNNPDDFALYPKRLESDILKLTEAKCDVLFCPEQETMYPVDSIVRFDFGPLNSQLEGAFRPGHFSGVALVVSKLFHIIQPDKAYFGQKDFQQLKIVERLIRDLNFTIQLRSIPIQRESDGLAMSSRNQRLSAEQRKNAVIFYESLLWARQKLREGLSFPVIREEIIKRCQSVPGVKVEYLEMADASNLTIQDAVTPNTILLIAGYVGDVRLIDNLFMNE